MYQRDGGRFYAKDRRTGQRLSLATSDPVEAKRLLAAKNQAIEPPSLNVAMARVYLSAQSAEFTSRTWGQLIELVAQGQIYGSSGYFRRRTREGHCFSYDGNSKIPAIPDRKLYLVSCKYR
jgi:hypothetical protein